jgi:hypothetical protein
MESIDSRRSREPSYEAYVSLCERERERRLRGSSMAGKNPPRTAVPPTREKAPHVARALAVHPLATPSVQAKAAGMPSVVRPVAAHVQAMLGRRAPAVQARMPPARPGGSRVVQAAQVAEQAVEMTTYVKQNGNLYETLDGKNRVFVSSGPGPSGTTQIVAHAMSGFYRKDVLGYLNFEVLEHPTRVASIVKVQSYAAGIGTILAFELANHSRGNNIDTMVAGMPADTSEAKKYYADLGFDYDAAEERERKRRAEVYKDVKDVDISKG